MIAWLKQGARLAIAAVIVIVVLIPAMVLLAVLGLAEWALGPSAAHRAHSGREFEGT